MNNSHVVKEQHKEEVKSQWWDGVLQGLAQRSGSAGNYNHNHIQCTSHAYYYTLRSPRHHHSQQVCLRLLSQTVPLCVCWEIGRDDFFSNWCENERQYLERFHHEEMGDKHCSSSNHVTDSQGYQ